ncbi:MAG: hydroxymethylbilane synthase [Sedimentisphaerales bacterium]|jgi:hydroxymethylbilane synthase
MKKTLTIATRTGSLAIVQTQIVVSAIRKLFPALDIRIKKIASEGDKDRRTTLWELKETGFFTSLLEDALLADQADVAVHSFKDLPTAIREGLTIAAVLNRKFPEDCLVCASLVKSLDELPKEAIVGTSSLRRTVQLKRLRNDLKCVPIRGNVPTRLKKLEQGDSLRDRFDAIVLARAGLERLGLGDKISIIFDPTQFIPSPAQGALAVEVRADDAETKEIVSKLDDKDARITTTAERLVFSALGCGCHAPAGVFAQIDGSKITISACFSDPDGQNFSHATISGPIAQSAKLAQSLADKLRQKSS